MSDFRIYKPRKDKNTNQFVGAASSIQVVDKKYKTRSDKEYVETQVFWTITPQVGEDTNGNASFDWKNEKNPNGKQIVMNLGDPDIGELLCVLNRVKDKVGQPSGQGLFHKTNETSNSSLKLEYSTSRTPDKYDNGYMLTISKKSGDELLKYSHSISLAEGELIKIILTDAIRRKYWVQ